MGGEDRWLFGESRGCPVPRCSKKGRVSSGERLCSLRPGGRERRVATTPGPAAAFVPLVRSDPRGPEHRVSQVSRWGEVAVVHKAPPGPCRVLSFISAGLTARDGLHVRELTGSLESLLGGGEKRNQGSKRVGETGKSSL